MQGMTRGVMYGVTLLGLMCLSACVGSHHGPPRGGPGGSYFGGASMVAAEPIAFLLNEFDTSGDRTITSAELAVGAEKAFIEVDINSDGAISPIEFVTWAEAAMGARNAVPGVIAFDANLNSIISRAEFSDRLQKEFARLDKNKDGNLVRAELLQTRRVNSKKAGQGGHSGDFDKRRPPPH